MRSVGIKALKNHLSEFVRAAQAGERVLVTDRKEIVAELVPPQPEGDPADTPMARGIRDGWLTPARRRGPLPDRGPLPPGERRLPFDQLMNDLEKDREDPWSTSTAP